MEKAVRHYRKSTLDERIARAQEELLKRKEKYERAVRRLEELMGMRKEQRRKELMRAISGSQRTHEEIMAFLRG